MSEIGFIAVAVALQPPLGDNTFLVMVNLGNSIFTTMGKRPLKMDI